LHECDERGKKRRIVEIWGFVGLTLRAATSADKGNWLPL